MLCTNPDSVAIITNALGGAGICVMPACSGAFENGGVVLVGLNLEASVRLDFLRKPIGVSLVDLSRLFLAFSMVFDSVRPKAMGAPCARSTVVGLASRNGGYRRSLDLNISVHLSQID